MQNKHLSKNARICLWHAYQLGARHDLLWEYRIATMDRLRKRVRGATSIALDSWLQIHPGPRPPYEVLSHGRTGGYFKDWHPDYLAQVFPYEGPYP
jgi:hypothetical protein